MAKRYYNLEKETKAFLKRMEETRGVLPDGAGIARINDYIVKSKGSGLFLGNPGLKTGIRFETTKSQYLRIVSNSSLQTGTDGFSFSFWFKNISGIQKTIISKNVSGAASSCEFEIFKQSVSGLIFIVSDGTSTYNASVAAGNILDGVSYYITCTYDSVDKTLKVYINNVLKTTLAFPNTPLQSTTAFNIGRRDNNSGLLDSIVNDVGYWKRTLSTSEISYIYNGGLGRPYLELLAYNPGILTDMSSYWALNEQGGTRRDWHGTNNLQSFNTPESDVGLINNFFYLS
jgi:hypothetical protein